MIRYLKHFVFLLPLLALIILITGSYTQSIPKDSVPTYEPKRFFVYPINVPDSLSFAGEAVPLQNFDVREGLDRELQINVYWQSQTLFLIKRSHRYLPVIESILRKNGVPVDFKYLAAAESGLMNVISPAEATGIWQILKAVAKENGLEVNSQVDERYHLEKSTEAACRYLKASYALFGSWTMAAASYNAGRAGISRLVQNQKQDNYYNLFLNEETARYIYRIIAIKVILEHPEKYGFYVDKKDCYAPFEYTEVPVDTSIASIADFAVKMGTTYKMIKIFNPWLRDFSLENKHRKTYYIKIPKKGYRESQCLEQ